MNQASDVERAERIGRSRARLFAVQAILFLTWQANFLLDAEGRWGSSPVKVSIWLLWVVTLLLLLATGGGLLRARSLRVLLNDELTRRNRTLAYVTGFWAAVGACMGLYVVGMFEPVAGRDALHITLSAAIAAALLTFALRERRSAREG
jgi:hypothetical protein